MHKCALMYLFVISSFLAFFLFAFGYLEIKASVIFRKAKAYKKSLDNVSQIWESPELAALTSLATQPLVRQEIKQETTEPNNSSRSENSTRQLYVTFHPKGRLGNKLFQYASMLGIARAQGRKLVVHPSFTLNKVFNLSYPTAEASTSEWPTIRQSCFGCYDHKLMTLPAVDVMVIGYLQSYKYFESIKQQIRHEFIFNKNIDSAADKILQSVLDKYNGSMLVGVHVRRGDFLVDKEYMNSVPEKSYFFKAFEWMRNHISSPKIVFVVVSDDLDWCNRTLTGNDIVILPPALPYVHLAILTKCDHVIMAGGTFGWWGSWLAGGHVVYFKGFMANSTMGNKFRKEDYFLPYWTGLNN